MATYKIAVMPGDGTGPEVTAEAVKVLKAAAAKYPYMDLTRVGIYGGSAGGQSTLRGLLAHGDFYKVAAADCGCHDNRMDKIWWNEQWMGWPIGPHYAASSNCATLGGYLAPRGTGTVSTKYGKA